VRYINLNLNNRVLFISLKDLDTRLSAFFKLFNKETCSDTNFIFFDIYHFRWFLFYLLAIKNFKQSIRVLKTSILNMLFDLFHECYLCICTYLLFCKS
jgi:hypothetical protein